MTEKNTTPFIGETKRVTLYNVLSDLTEKQIEWLKIIGHRVETVEEINARGGKILTGAVTQLRLTL
ncbi:MAG: hypothetical protein WC784_02305 [Candidatus Shapirobacteria bacterium]